MMASTYDTNFTLELRLFKYWRFCSEIRDACIENSLLTFFSLYHWRNISASTISWVSKQYKTFGNNLIKAGYLHAQNHSNAPIRHRILAVCLNSILSFTSSFKIFLSCLISLLVISAMMFSVNILETTTQKLSFWLKLWSFDIDRSLLTLLLLSGFDLRNWE